MQCTKTIHEKSPPVSGSVDPVNSLDDTLEASTAQGFRSR